MRYMFLPTLIMLTACMPTPDDREAVTQLVTVGPSRVDCVGVAPQRCLVVDGDLFYDTIEGFSHVEGTSYVLEVERQRMCGGRTGATCPADASAFRYILKRVVSQSDLS